MSEKWSYSRKQVKRKRNLASPNQVISKFYPGGHQGQRCRFSMKWAACPGENLSRNNNLNKLYNSYQNCIVTLLVDPDMGAIYMFIPAVGDVGRICLVFCLFWEPGRVFSCAIRGCWIGQFFVICCQKDCQVFCDRQLRPPPGAGGVKETPGTILSSSSSGQSVMSMVEMDGSVSFEKAWISENSNHIPAHIADCNLCPYPYNSYW